MLKSRRYFIWALLVALMASGCMSLSPLGGSVSSIPALNIQQVAHIGGAAVSIAVRGNYAYLGLSYELLILDITNRAQPRQIATLPIPATDIALINE